MNTPRDEAAFNYPLLSGAIQLNRGQTLIDTNDEAHAEKSPETDPCSGNVDHWLHGRSNSSYEFMFCFMAG